MLTGRCCSTGPSLEIRGSVEGVGAAAARDRQRAGALGLEGKGALFCYGGYSAVDAGVFQVVVLRTIRRYSVGLL
jgi:hypothetical protein